MLEKYNGYALVTGAAGGIGEAICRQLAKDGYDVAICDYPSPAMKEAAASLCEELKRDYGVKAMTAFADISSYEDCEAMINSVKAEFGENCAIYVASAGISLNAQFHNATYKELDAVVDIDLKGTVYTCHLILPMMMKQKYGSIVTIASVAGVYDIGSPIYSAAKGGVVAFTRGLAREYAAYNIRCNIVAPGATLTPLTYAYGEEEIEAHRRMTPLRIMGLPQDMAEAVSYCNSARMLTGEYISPNGGLRNYSYLYQEEPED